MTRKLWITTVLIFIIATAITFVASRFTKQRETRENQQQVDIRLKWLHQAQFAGFYYAKEAGYYGNEGLDVTLHPGGIDYPAIQMVASGADDFGVTAADQILLARDKGIPVVAIACIYRKSPFVLFSLKESGINRVEDFRGKKIGLKLGGNEELTYRAMMKRAGISFNEVQEVPVKFDISLLLTGGVDVWPGYSINEPITAQEKGFSVNLIWPDSYDIHLYADVLFTTEEMVLTQPSVVQSVVNATVKGWEEAYINKERAITYTLQQSNNLNRDHERKMLDASIALIKVDDKPIGWMDISIWQEMQKMLLTNEFLETNVDVSKAFRIDFVQRNNK